MKTRVLRVVAFLLILLAGAPAALHAQLTEYRVKAEFIERFTRFIDWPLAAETTVPFVIGVYGRNPFGVHLDNMAGTRKIKGRAIVVRQLHALTEIDGCDLLFISRDEEAVLPAILKHVAGKPVLTIGDSPGFLEAGVQINFSRVGEQISFEINETASTRSGLTFSSKLLRLARVVLKEKH